METSEPVDAAPGRAFVSQTGEILADVALATTSGGELALILDRVAQVTLDASDADHVSLFLLDADRRALRMWAAGSRVRDEELWNRSVEMPPIELDEVPARRALFELGEPFGIEDAPASPLVPAHWVHAFGVASLVVAPLRHGEETLGLLVADYRRPRSLPIELTELVGLIARTTALAVGNVRLTAALADRAAALQGVLDATQALLSSRSLTEVAEQVADAIVKVLGAHHLSVQVFDDSGSRYRTLVQRGVVLPTEGDLADLPHRARDLVARAWRDGPAPGPVVLTGLDDLGGAPVEIPPEITSALVLPLLRPGPELFGFVLVGLTAAGPPDQSTIDLARVLTSHVAFAVDRAQLDEKVAMGAEFARTLLTLADLREDSSGLLAGLRRAVPTALGFRVVNVRLVGSRHGGPALPFEQRLWRQWRARRTRPEVIEWDGLAYAPAWDGARVVGVVQAAPLRAPMAPHERASLEAVASAIGEAVARERLRDHADLRARAAALAAESADMAYDIHIVLARLLGDIGDAALRIGNGSAQDVAGAARRIVELVRAGKRELDQGRRSLFALATADPGRLDTTLRDVIDSLATRLGVAADLAVRGDVRPLPEPVEQALVRVVQEALARIEPRSRASALAVRLEFRPAEVELLIRDDGVNLHSRDEGALVGTHFGLRVMQRRLQALGGDLDVELAQPRGLLLRATVPA